MTWCLFEFLGCISTTDDLFGQGKMSLQFTFASAPKRHTYEQYPLLAFNILSHSRLMWHQRVLSFYPSLPKQACTWKIRVESFKNTHLQETLVASNGDERMARQLLSAYSAQPVKEFVSGASTPHYKTTPERPNIGNNVSVGSEFDYDSEEFLAGQRQSGRQKARQKRRSSGVFLARFHTKINSLIYIGNHFDVQSNKCN